ncbi:MAG: UDP-N-acetylglucosamine 1-carboxyvinyltransferase [Thermoanaerobaculales bacterium]|jgi:UDP-N-acetylglucosamine 1-carboxyvinyltransferase|nr:UDP-N-acetylglucosamine 1-carboxyvinyltransferase [Thermoanaerobaculales bacterium]
MTPIDLDPIGDETSAYVIRGGNPIGGTVKPGGNKNAALPMLAACLLGGEPVTLVNVPQIRDVRMMLRLIEALGAEVVETAPDRWSINAGELTTRALDPTLARQIRASFLLAGPLVARWGRAVLPRPGGDRIGRRPLDTHVNAFRALGAEVEVEADRYVIRAPGGLTGTDLFLDEMSVMGTENAVMAASLARGTTTIRNAASEPHVQELCRLVNGMGGSVEGIGTNVLTIEGRRSLGGAEVAIGPDPVEVGSFIGLAAVTGGELRITDAEPHDHHRMTALGFARLGIRWRVEGNDIVVPAEQELVVRDDLHGAIPKIDDGPWPAFPPDLVSIMVVLATQATGTILIHEKMFESRLFWVDRLIAMGARIVLCDPHRAVVVGPSKLFGQQLASPDIRAGMALVIAALCAEGESVIHNIHQVERGYELLHRRLSSLGADVERVER